MKYWLLIITLILFLIFLPLSLSIDFMQNDDWNRYRTVAAFLGGNFELLEVTATTFYTQGFIGAAFANIFSIQRLPVLTLVFGCANFFLFSLISFKFFKQNLSSSILLGLLLFFNPLHFYSLFGFMTEVYLLTFCLISIYFYYSNLLGPANLFWILGFFAKQWAVVLPAAFLTDLILRKKYKFAFIQFAILAAVLGYYFYLFPKTNEMTGQKSFELSNFESAKYIATHAYAYFIYLTVFSLPLVISLVFSELSKVKSEVKIIVIGGVAAFLAKFLFIKTTYPWKDFPLYPNIFTDKGFFLQGMEGEAHTNIYTPLINFLDEIGLLFLMLAAVLLILRKKIVINFEAAAILIGFILIVGTPFVFDRYLLVIIPIAFFYLLRLNDYKFKMGMLIGFLLVQMIISLDYGIEYISRQKLIWDRSVEIQETENIPPERIVSSHAWNKLYKVNFGDAVYWFRYSNMLPNSNEKVAAEFWSKGIFTKTNIDIVRIQNR